MPGARLIIGDKPFSMTQGIGGIGDGAFDGAAFIGYHAGAGHATGVIAHTYSSVTVLEMRVQRRAAQRGRTQRDPARPSRGAGDARCGR